MIFEIQPNYLLSIRNKPKYLKYVETDDGQGYKNIDWKSLEKK